MIVCVQLAGFAVFLLAILSMLAISNCLLAATHGYGIPFADLFLRSIDEKAFE